MNPEDSVSFDNTAVAFASKSDKELREMHLLFSIMHWEYLTKIGTKFVNSALKFNFPIKGILKNTLFKQFCGGETLQECMPVIGHLQDSGVFTILDYAVEGEDKEENFEANLRTLQQIIELDAASDAILFTVLKITSIAPPALLEKIQKGDELTLIENELFENCKKRLDILCSKAAEKKVKLLIDAEESWIQGTIDALTYSMMEKYNRKEAIVFNTFQMYRADMAYNLRNATAMANAQHFYLGAKLVRGAYMSKEKLNAAKSGIKNPIFEKKEETDQAFNDGLKWCIANLKQVELCCGTHNEASTRYLIRLMKENEISPQDLRITFAQLYGMSDHISYNLAKSGYRSAKYLPFGPVHEVLPYLFRRAEENTAVAGQNHRQLDLIKKEMKRRNLS